PPAESRRRRGDPAVAAPARLREPRGLAMPSLPACPRWPSGDEGPGYHSAPGAPNSRHFRPKSERVATRPTVKVSGQRCYRPEASVLEPNSLVLGDRFRVLGRRGGGGMGEVYLAEQVSLGRRVALKVLRREVGQQPGMSERFQREARLLSSVEHPAVVRV